MARRNKGRTCNRRPREAFTLAMMLVAGVTPALRSMAIAAGLASEA